MRHRRLHGSARGRARSSSRACGASSTAATTRPGIALVDEAGDLFVEKRAGKLANLQTASSTGRPHAGDRPRPHALGDARPAERPQRPSPRGLQRRDHGHPQRDHRELPRAAGRARGTRATRWPPRPTPRRSPTSSRRPTRATWPTPCAAALRRVEGAYAMAVMHRGEPDRLVGARMNVPLVVGLGDGETFLASPTSPRSSPTRTASSSSRRATSPTFDPDRRRRHGHRRLAARAPRVDGRRGRPRRPRRAATSTSCSRRCTSSRRRSARRSPAASGATAGSASTSSIRSPSGSRAWTASSSSPAAAPTTPRSSAPTLIQEWTGLPARATVGSEFRYSPPPLDGRTLVIAVTQSGETADTIAADPPRPGTWLPDHRGDEHRRLGDHPRGRRGPLPPGRPRDRGGRHQDVRDPGDDARRSSPRRSAEGAGHAAARRRSASSDSALRALPDAAQRALELRVRLGGARAPLRQLARLHVRRPRRRRTRPRSRARSSSRRSATSTPRATPPASSSTARSRSSTPSARSSRSRRGRPSYDKLISNVMEGRARDARVIAVATEGDAQIERFADDVCWVPDTHEALTPGPRGHPAPAVRVPHGRRPGHGRGPAAQPRQVRHGRVAPA